LLDALQVGGQLGLQVLSSMVNSFFVSIGVFRPMRRTCGRINQIKVVIWRQIDQFDRLSFNGMPIVTRWAALYRGGVGGRPPLAEAGRTVPGYDGIAVLGTECPA
jgi:hypothetical protein